MGRRGRHAFADFMQWRQLLHVAFARIQQVEIAESDVDVETLSAAQAINGQPMTTTNNSNAVRKTLLAFSE
jgi:hypothetical protein